MGTIKLKTIRRAGIIVAVLLGFTLPYVLSATVNHPDAAGAAWAALFTGCVLLAVRVMRVAQTSYRNRLDFTFTGMAPPPGLGDLFTHAKLADTEAPSAAVRTPAAEGYRPPHIRPDQRLGGGY